MPNLFTLLSTNDPENLMVLQEKTTPKEQVEIVLSDITKTPQIPVNEALILQEKASKNIPNKESTEKTKQDAEENKTKSITPIANKEVPDPKDQQKSEVVGNVKSKPAMALAPSPALTSNLIQKRNQKLLQKARIALANRQKSRKAQILRLFDQNLTIRNQDIQKILKVSDATVSRYLKELTQKNKIRKIGTTGRSVRYIKN